VIEEGIIENYMLIINKSSVENTIRKRKESGFVETDIENMNAVEELLEIVQ
jgi:hypothetical protein